MQREYAQTVGEQLLVEAITRADRAHQDEHIRQQVIAGGSNERPGPAFIDGGRFGADNGGAPFHPQAHLVVLDFTSLRAHVHLSGWRRGVGHAASWFIGTALLVPQRLDRVLLGRPLRRQCAGEKGDQHDQADDEGHRCRLEQQNVQPGQPGEQPL